MMSKDFLVGLVVGLVLFFLVSKFMSPKTSEYTFQPFTGTDANAVKTSYTAQQNTIASEMKTALTDGIAQKKTKDQLVAISNQYNDYSCALTKAYSEWNIRNASA